MKMPMGDPWRRLNGFWRYVIIFLFIYLLLGYGFGYLSMWITHAANPQPIPSKLLSTYLFLVLVSLSVQIAISDRSLHEFWDPLAALLRGTSTDGQPLAGPAKSLRLAALALPPLLVGWTVYQQLVPKVASAVTSRQQHPTLPDDYASLENPFRKLPAAEQDKIVKDGIVLYQTNCRPCHGTPAAGDGPMARGFQPRPVAFTDAGTIDTIVEPYLMWRVEKGGIGLPAVSTPWNSAMPPWEGELKRDDIWKIIMAEYHIAGKSPRITEKSE